MLHSRFDRKSSLAAIALGLFAVTGMMNQSSLAAGAKSTNDTKAGTAASAPSSEGTQPLRLVTLPKGTPITATVGQTLASDKNHWGDPFTARLVAPVKVDGKTVLPRGTQVTGRVLEVKRHELKVVLTSTVVDGVYCDLATNPRRPSDIDRPKVKGHKEKKDNSILSAHTHLTFKLAKPATIPVAKA